MFLVALYECSENYELENPDIDRMYCSKHNWIGERPHCYSLGGEEEGEGEGLSSCNLRFCFVLITFNNNNLIDYDGEEEEDYEEGEETEAEEESPATPKSTAKETQGREENSVLEQEESKPDQSQGGEEEDGDEDEEDDNEVEKSEVHPVTTTTEAPVVDLCQVNNGGCDHNCRFSREDVDAQSRGLVECSCFAGFTLDSGDGRTCHGESQN